MDTRIDPVIEDLIKWLKENLPPEAKEEDIFKKVRKMQKVYDILVGLAFEEFYNYSLGIEQQSETGLKQEQHLHHDTDSKQMLREEREIDVDRDVTSNEDDDDEEQEELRDNLEDENNTDDDREQQQQDRDTSKQKHHKQDDDCPTKTTLDEVVSEKLTEIRDYIVLNEEKLVKTQKLNASRAKLDLRKDQYELINSIRLDNCMDLISRYNRLMSKK